MLKGVEYAHSPEKRKLDQTVARLANPAYFAARLVSSQLVVEPGENPVFEQQRVGRSGQAFTIFKFKTEDPYGHPINSIARVMNRSGLDEIAQVQNIREGTMSAVGHRPIIGEQFKEFMDNITPTQQQRYKRTVLPTRPGAFSTYGLGFHTGYDPVVDQHEERAECDIKDVIDGSVAYDLRLIKTVCQTAFSGRFTT